MNPLYASILIVLIVVCVVNMLRSRNLLHQMSYAIVLVPLMLRTLGLK